MATCGEGVGQATCGGEAGQTLCGDEQYGPPVGEE
jgi:hypothetical protein